MYICHEIQKFIYPCYWYEHKNLMTFYNYYHSFHLFWTYYKPSVKIYTMCMYLAVFKYILFQLVIFFLRPHSLFPFDTYSVIKLTYRKRWLYKFRYNCILTCKMLNLALILMVMYYAVIFSSGFTLHGILIPSITWKHCSIAHIWMVTQTHIDNSSRNILLHFSITCGL